jgi:hypothetical protein
MMDTVKIEKSGKMPLLRLRFMNNSGYRWNRESTALPFQYCHLFKQSDE